MIPPRLSDDVAALRKWRLDLFPDPVSPIDRSVPQRPMDIPILEAPPLAGSEDPVADIDVVLAALDGPGRGMGIVERILHDEARTAAVESRKRAAVGDTRDLEGLAFGVKDVIQVEGSPTTFGSPAYADFIPVTTAQVVRNLREAGAILVAKLATYEFASGPNSRTRNPWDARRRSGGSSSGSAAAVGAGLLPLALGTDSGGSIRVPAAWCGAVGLKPTRGRVSTAGTPPLSWHLDHTGMLTRSVVMSATVLGVLAGERSVPALPKDNGPFPLSGLRIGVLGGWFDVTDPEVSEVTAGAISTLDELGAKILPVQLPLIERINPDAVKRVLVDAESAALHDPNRPNYGEVFRDLIGAGSELRAVDYIHALRLGALLAEATTSLFCGLDVLVCATSPIVAPLEEQDVVSLGGRELGLADVVARNTSLFNISGHPALTVPSGLGRNTGMPIALQVIGPHWRDDLCLRVGMAFQERVGLIGPPRLGESFA